MNILYSTYFNIFQHRTIEGSASSTYHDVSRPPQRLLKPNMTLRWVLFATLLSVGLPGRFWTFLSWWVTNHEPMASWFRHTYGTGEFRNPEVVLIVSALSFFGQPIVRQLKNTKHQVSPGKHINAYQCNPIILQSVHQQVFSQVRGGQLWFHWPRPATGGISERTGWRDHVAQIGPRQIKGWIKLGNLINGLSSLRFFYVTWLLDSW